MNSSRGWKIATIRGIEIRLDASLIFLLFYVVFIAAARFSGVASEAGIDVIALKGSPLVWGILFALGLFVSIVLHELGHAFVAQAADVKVRSITLMMLGGVSSIDRIPERPYFEFKLAVAGPLVSLALAALLFALRSNTASQGVSFYAYWLGSANLALGIFNLLPAFPLDGGRALRSLLAARLGMLRATQASVKASKILAVILGALGFLSFNILLMLIAFFIYTTAQGELFLLLSKRSLRSTTAGEVAVRVQPIAESASLTAALEQMFRTANTTLPVTTQSGSAALVELAQIKELPKAFWQTKLVRDVMTVLPRALDVHEAIGPALPELLAAPDGAMPVKDEERVIGFVRYSNLAELLQLKSIDEKKAA